MKTRVGKLVLIVGIVLPLLASGPLRAQAVAAPSGGAVLSGKVTGASGAGMPGVKVSIRNLATGQSTEAQTDAAGLYNLPNVAPGDYQISIAAEGFESRSAKVTLTSGAKQNMDFALAASGNNAETPAGQLPGAPAPAKTEPTLQDLGFPTSESQSNAKEQALLDKRTHMLKIHQRLGLITTIPLMAAVLSSAGAGGRNTSSASIFMLHWEEWQRVCISRPHTLPFARPALPGRKPAGKFVCTRPWPGSTAPG